MPSSLPKRTAKKKIVAPAAPTMPAGRILELKPSRLGMHHGLTLGTLILVFVAVGSLVAAGISYQRMKTVSVANKSVETKLAQAAEQNADLIQQLKGQEALMALSAKTPPREIVLKEYSSPNLSLDYPEECAIVKATDEFPALVINCYEGKVDIFRTKDFPGGTRALPDGVYATKVGSADNPKIVPYDVWAYRTTENASDKILFDKLVASIKVVK